MGTSRPGVCATLIIASALTLTGRSPAISPQDGPIGDFDGQGDIGAPKIAGAAVYNAASQEYTLAAGGANMWGERDEFRFVWKRITGDFILQARVEFVGNGVDPHRKAGWMVRPALEADAPYVDGVIHGDGLTSLQFRRTLYVVRDVKKGEAFTADNVRAIRPGFGLLPKHYESLLGRHASRDIARGTPMAWDLVG